ncbi:MAG TPA: phosphate signaling complex protein PhoU [Bryobacteraceae bacterium]|jgi:phosphate transport system protein|nr:phosphate signaling complex protein PhoU [Bryobacteraceae bacterium]
MRPFVSELGELQNKILEMGGLVESSIHNSIRSLVDRDDALMANIWQAEQRINQLDIEIDGFATRLLALHQPVAKDLRFLTATIKINSDLERMGDLAVNIAQRSLSLLSRPPLKPLVDVPHMSRIVESMVRKSLDAFVQRDEDLARSVLLSDDEVDDLKNSVYQELLGSLESGTAPAGTAFDIIFIAHNLERVADHATNIAEDVLFLIKGIDVRHHHQE